VGNTVSHMNKRGLYIERDRHGRERLVMLPSNDRGIRVQLAEVEERARVLTEEIGRLRTSLSSEQRNAWTMHRDKERLQVENGNLYHEIDNEKNRARKLEDLLDAEEKRAERLEEKIRLMKRGITHHGEQSDGYRRRYEEKVAEVELLRVRLRERDDLIRLNEDRLIEKDKSLIRKNETIAYFKSFLRSEGFRVED
jgi:predicted  nucleic acid-binding Zn-ribbon protein